MLTEVEHPLGGRFTIAGPPARMSRTPGAVRSPAPRLGEHTDELLEHLLGYDRGRIDALRTDNVI
jgi:crotonobetainyl-CoA:carnitine CoA-transferase CaiB-like acyl-CoA transferase